MNYIKKYMLKHRKLSTVFIDDETFIKWQYEYNWKKKLNIKNPTTFNEKIQWLKVHWQNDLLTKCADKYQVRSYVKERGAPEILNELYAVYSNVDEIDFTCLPQSFVLKVNHGSGQNIICQDKKDLNINEAKRKLKRYMKNSHYYYGREWSYKNITPKIVCEKYLDENGHSPIDYKFFCFHGKPCFIQVDVGRFSDHTRNIYDTEWNTINVEYRLKNYERTIEKPAGLEKMLNYAALLSAEFIFARVDFYSVNDAIIFGEMTFYPGNGMERFFPEKYDEIFGALLTLPI